MRDKYVFAYCFLTLVLDLHVTYKLAHIYDHVTKLRKQNADVVQNHENIDVQNQTIKRSNKKLKLSARQAYDCLTD
jgi:hypothetical protein